MSLFSDPKDGVIDDIYIQALEDDDISVQNDVIENAKQGNPEAIYKVGCVYASKKNTEMAILWLGTSSALGFYESQVRIGDLFKEYSPERALIWYRRAQSSGIARAGSRIGDQLLKNKQYKEAEEEYIKAAKSGDAYSQNHLGAFYRDGYTSRRNLTHGVDYEEAFKWFRKAADQNYSESQYNLARLYEGTWCTEGDKYQALYWYEKCKAGGYGGVDDAIKKLNKEGYFYFPHLDNISSLAKSTADVRCRVGLSEL